MIRKGAILLATTLTTLALTVVLIRPALEHRHYETSEEDVSPVEYHGFRRIVRQQTDKDCGPAALKMALAHYGVYVSLDSLSSITGLNGRGSSLLGLKRAAERFGFRAEGWRLSLQDMLRRTLPAIVRVGGCHFVVVEKAAAGMIGLLDPREGEVHLSMRRFESVWDHVALIIEVAEPAWKGKR